MMPSRFSLVLAGIGASQASTRMRWIMSSSLAPSTPLFVMIVSRSANTVLRKVLSETSPVAEMVALRFTTAAGMTPPFSATASFTICAARASCSGVVESVKAAVAALSVLLMVMRLFAVLYQMLMALPSTVWYVMPSARALFGTAIFSPASTLVYPASVRYFARNWKTAPLSWSAVSSSVASGARVELSMLASSALMPPPGIFRLSMKCGPSVASMYSSAMVPYTLTMLVSSALVRRRSWPNSVMSAIVPCAGVPASSQSASLSPFFSV